jgi:hypothetical protein
MARDESAPFARGETFYNGSPIDSTNLGGANLEGKEFVFEPNSQDQGTGYPAAGDPAGRPIRVKVVRNRSGGNLKSARVARFEANGGSASPYEGAVDGYCYQATDRPAGVVDEFLPAAGVPNLDLFYIVVEGPTQVTNTHASPTTFAVGDIVITAASGASATDDLAGRVTNAAPGAITAEQITQRVGRAAATNSGADGVFNATTHHLL